MAMQEPKEEDQNNNSNTFGGKVEKPEKATLFVPQNDLESTLLNDGQMEAIKNLPDGVKNIKTLLSHSAQENQEEAYCAQAGEELAPSITEFLGENDIKFSEIDPSAIDPCLKCIQGDYIGRFTYLSNCTSEQEETKGISIGGKPDYN